jgi:hypothetical protein
VDLIGTERRRRSSYCLFECENENYRIPWGKIWNGCQVYLTSKLNREVEWKDRLVIDSFPPYEMMNSKSFGNGKD